MRISIRANEKILGEHYKTPRFVISDDALATEQGRALAMERFNTLARTFFDDIRNKCQTKMAEGKNPHDTDRPQPGIQKAVMQDEEIETR
jgi:hypothetical protein